MPIPNLDTIGEWSPTQLAKFISQTILVEPQILPSSLSLDNLSVAQDLDVGGNLVVGGVVQGVSGIATSVFNTLPSNPVHGQIHELRLDVSPFSHEFLVYDALERQWTSVFSRFSFATANASTGSTYPQPATSGEIGRVHVIGGKLFWDIGLIPQVRLISRFRNQTAGNIARVGTSMYQYNDTDPSLSVVETVNGPTVTGATFTIRTSSWLTFTTPPTEDNIVFVLAIGPNTGGTCDYTDSYFEVRWVKQL